MNDTQALSQPVRRLRNRLEALVRTRLWLQVVVGLAAGIVVGLLLGPDLGWVAPEASKIIGSWLALPGKFFLGLIGFVLVPLIVGSIIEGLNGAASGAELRSVGGRLVLFVLVTTTIAAALGVILALTVDPGSYVDLAVQGEKSSVPAPEGKGFDSIKGRVPELIAGLLPQSPLHAFLERDMLAIVIVAILLGIACKSANQDRVQPLLRFFDALLEVAMTVVKWALFLAPWAVFGLTAQLVAKVGFGTIIGMGAYVLTVLAGLFGLWATYCVVVAVMGRINPLDFAARISEVQLLAFSTSSSAAVMPLSIDTAVTKLDVPDNIAGLVIPLGATINMAGTALYQSVAVVFLAQMSGVELTLFDLSLIVMTLVVSSIGAPGTPGVSIVILSNIVVAFGISPAGLVLILGVDRILDMCRTVVNVTGDLTACVLLRGVGGNPANDEATYTSVPNGGA